MQFSTIVISAIAVIASVHGASIPAMDTPESSPVELEARSYNDQDGNNNLEKRSPGYGTMGGFGGQMGGWVVVGVATKWRFVNQDLLTGIPGIA
ncbi:hypothetical protein BASA83_009821 [Batrachochytrium salamandrivorans]|nr:hypothetical protein BASA83_009821 [Batrachochytrium salamandrivorans]